jgi:hypothetical protein
MSQFTHSITKEREKRKKRKKQRKEKKRNKGLPDNSLYKYLSLNWHLNKA